MKRLAQQKSITFSTVQFISEALHFWQFDGLRNPAARGCRLVGGKPSVRNSRSLPDTTKPENSRLHTFQSRHGIGLAHVTTHKRWHTMQRQINPIIPPHITEALDASLDDIAAGRLNDVDAVQAEARQMLAEHERNRPVASVLPRAKRTKVA